MFLTSGLASLALGAPSYDCAKYSRYAMNCEDLWRLVETIDGWHRTSYVALGITIVVILLGGVTAFVEMARKKRSPLLMAALGSLVSVLTATKVAVFEDDYKTMSRKCRRATSEIREAWSALGHLETADSREQVEYWMTRLDEHVRAFREIEKAAETAAVPSSEPSLALLLPAARAGAPRSIGMSEQFADDAATMRFSGVGVGSTIAAARLTAIRNARRDVMDVLGVRAARASGSGDVTELARFVAAGATVEKDAFVRDRDSGVYTYLVVLAVDRRLLGMQANLFATQINGFKGAFDEATLVAGAAFENAVVSVAASKIARFDAPRELSSWRADPATRRRDEDLLVRVESSLRACKGGDADSCAEGVMRSCRDAPGTSTRMWLQLGAVFDAAGFARHARKAFETAARSGDDPDATRAYGLFLLRRGEFSSALDAFHKTLDRKPGDATALGGLEVLQRKL